MSPDAITLVASLIGALAGGLAFLFKALILSKNERIVELLDERDYWRDAAIGSGQTLPDFEAWWLRRHPPERR